MSLNTYTPEIGEEICLALMQGISLNTTCKKLGIATSTVCTWLTQPDKVEFAEKYARAREVMADTLAEEILDIADNEKLTPDSRRIRVDVRKWYAGKVRPKKYGDKTTQEITGDIQHTHAVRYIKPDGTGS